MGATTGATPPTPGYLKGVRRLCDKYGILYIADEVMCGMGRTGTLHAFEQDDVVPDLVTIAKGLGGGYQPIGAVLASETIVSALKAGSGLFQHGHTYICHATAASAALAVQQVIARDNLLAAVKQQGAYLQQALREVLGELPHVGDTRGRGLFAGVELVRDKDNKTPVRSCPEAACCDQSKLYGAWVDGLPHGRHDRWSVWRSHPDRAAVYHHPGADRLCGRYAEQRDPRRDGKIMINRLPPLAEQEWDERQRQLAEEIINGPRGALLPPFEPLLRSPELMAHAQRMGSIYVIAARWVSVFLNWRFC